MKKEVFKKTSALLALTLVLAGLLAACGTSAPGTSQSSSSESQGVSASSQSAAPQTPAVITDRAGNSLTIPASTGKIISMAPSITETLVHLGLGDQIIAVDKYSVGTPGIREGLPTFDIMAPDIESIAKLAPDIIFATGMSRAKGEDPFAPVTDLGVVMTYIPSAGSIAAIKEDIRFLGTVTGTKDKAEAIIVEMEKQIADITATIGDRKCGKRVFFEIAAAPNLYSFGTGTFLHEIIELLGAENILADQQKWVSVSEEVVLQKNPEVIFTNIDYADDPVGDISKRNGWDVVAAVKDKQVYQVDKNTSSRPNEFVASAIAEMAQVLYPELDW